MEDKDSAHAAIPLPEAVRRYRRQVWRLYAEDGWNLNKIPLLSDSVLQLLPGRIAGISRCVRSLVRASSPIRCA